MGHASATTTLSTYAHLWPTAEDKTRAAASGMAAAVSCHLPEQLFSACFLSALHSVACAQRVTRSGLADPEISLA